MKKKKHVKKHFQKKYGKSSIKTEKKNCSSLWEIQVLKMKEDIVRIEAIL